MQLQHRIEIIVRHTTRVRVMIALLDLANDCGTRRLGGMTRIPPLTQTTVAEYVGTSREVVGAEMSRLRRRMILYYTRRFIDVDVQAIERELARSGVRPYDNEMVESL